MTKKSNRYGITDEELLCDGKVDIPTSADLRITLDGHEYTKPFINDEERLITNRLESFITQRNECRNAALVRISASMEEKIGSSLKIRTTGNESSSSGQKRFSKLIDFLETLSKECSGIKIERDEKIDLVRETEKPIDVKSRENISRPSVVSVDSVKSSDNAFQFIPVNFSTPKEGVPTFAHSTPTLISQTPITPRKNGHPALTRTDTNAACMPLGSSVLDNEMHPNAFPASRHSEQLDSSTLLSQPSKNDKTVASSSASIENETEETSQIDQNDVCKFKQLWIKRLPFSDFLKIGESTEAYVTEFDKRPKDVLHSLAKRSVKEKIACWTRKNAPREVTINAVEYFCDLLTGKTVYGFDGKMLNFNGDEPGTRFSMASIVNSYVSVVQKDILLVECAAAVLLSLMIRIPEFKSMLYSKLFAASPLLCVDKDECLKQISEIKSVDGNMSEAVNSWCINQSAVIRLFVLLHCPTTKKNAVVSDVDFDFTSRLWSFLAFAAMEQSAFASALAAEILKLCGKYLAKVYGVQFQKLIKFLTHTTLRAWEDSLKDDSSFYGLSRMATNYYLAVLDMALKELPAN